MPDKVIVHQLVQVVQIGQTLTPSAASPEGMQCFRFFCACGSSWTREDMVTPHIKDQNRD